MNVVLDLGQTPFSSVGSTQQGATFEFIDTAATKPATLAAGDQPIYYDSTSDDITDIQADMIQAINNGSTVISGIDTTNVSVAGLSGLTFNLADSTGNLVTYEFVDTSSATTVTAGDVAIDYDSTTDTMADVRQDIANTINAYSAITGVDSVNVPTLASLDQQTFQLTDDNGTTATFEFIDSSGSSSLTNGDVAITFNSRTDNFADICADMAASINGSGLDVTAIAQTDGVALFGGSFSATYTGGSAPFTSSTPLSATVTPDGVALFGTSTFAFSPGSTPFSQGVTYAGANCGATAQLRPDGSVALYGTQITFNAGTTPFVQNGRTSGDYQLQVRLQAETQIPGSEINYSNIRYATNGITIEGMPNSSPLLTNTASTGTNTTFATAQQVGNVLTSAGTNISVSGYLSSLTNVNWYSFTLQDEVATDALTQVFPTTYPVTLSVNDADGLARPDTDIYIFDSTGKLIYEGTNSDITDSQVHLGGNVADSSGTQYGTDDGTIGPINLPMASGGSTYFVAVAGQDVFPDALSQQLTRQEPVDSVNRVVEDHDGSTTGSLIANQSAQPISLTPNAYTLSDVTLYSTAADNGGTVLDTVDPLDGGYETNVTNGGILPQSPTVTYGDIAMRADGELFGITDDPNSDTLAGQYVQLSTSEAQNAVSTTADGILSYDVDPVTGSVVEQPNVGFDANALAYGPYSAAVNNYPVFIVGDRAAGNQVPFTNNLLYELNANGTAIAYPDTNGARLGRNIVPLAALATAPTIIVPEYGATDNNTTAQNGVPADDAAYDILGNTPFTLTDATKGGQQEFEFNSGPNVNFTSATPGEAIGIQTTPKTFTLTDNNNNSETYEFVSAPVLTFNGLDLGTQFSITNDAKPPVTKTFYITDGTAAFTVPTGDVAITVTDTDTQAELEAAIVAAINGAGFNITASGWVTAAGQARVSVINGTTLTENPAPTFPAVAVTAGAAGISGGGNAPADGNWPIYVTETDPSAVYGAEIVAAIQASPFPNFNPSYVDRTGPNTGPSYGRLTIYGATNASTFTNIASSWNVQLPVVVPGAVQIVLNAADTAERVAQQIALSINSANRIRTSR